jgi:hypothetical protein
MATSQTPQPSSLYMILAKTFVSTVVLTIRSPNSTIRARHSKLCFHFECNPNGFYVVKTPRYVEILPSDAEFDKKIQMTKKDSDLPEVHRPCFRCYILMPPSHWSSYKKNRKPNTTCDMALARRQRQPDRQTTKASEADSNAREVNEPQKEASTAADPTTIHCLLCRYWFEACVYAEHHSSGPEQHELCLRCSRLISKNEKKYHYGEEVCFHVGSEQNGQRLILSPESYLCNKCTARVVDLKEHQKQCTWKLCIYCGVVIDREVCASKHGLNCEKLSCEVCGQKKLTKAEYLADNGANCNSRPCSRCGATKLARDEYVFHEEHCDKSRRRGCGEVGLTDDEYDANHGKKCDLKCCWNCCKNRLSETVYDLSHGSNCVIKGRCPGCYNGFFLAFLDAHMRNCELYICGYCRRQQPIADIFTNQLQCYAELQRVKAELKESKACAWLPSTNATPCPHPVVEDQSLCSKHQEQRDAWDVNRYINSPEDKRRIKEIFDERFWPLLQQVAAAGGHPLIHRLLSNLHNKPRQVAICDAECGRLGFPWDSRWVYQICMRNGLGEFIIKPFTITHEGLSKLDLLEIVEKGYSKNSGD